jgi:hypothetical protein
MADEIDVLIDHIAARKLYIETAATIVLGTRILSKSQSTGLRISEYVMPM